MKRVVLGLGVMMTILFSISRGADSDFVSASATGPREIVTALPPRTAAGTSSSPQRRAENGSNNGTLAAYTLFRFDPKYGDISVQPIFGRVNGAQICLEW
jgi:hypothetical protein